MTSITFLAPSILSGALFGLGSYALIRLWLEPRRWRNGLPVALLVVGTRPFGAHMDTFFGYPARLFKAGWVASILGGAGIAAVDAETVLHFDTGVAHVDLPRSGVRSLWTGSLLLLAATWIEGCRIGGRWLAVAGIFTAHLMLANTGRAQERRSPGSDEYGADDAEPPARRRAHRRRRRSVRPRALPDVERRLHRLHAAGFRAGCAV